MNMDKTKIEEIKSKLTGNAEKDIQFLFSNLKTCESDPDLFDEIKKMIDDLSSSVKREKLILPQEYTNALIAARKQIDQKDYRAAITSLNSLEEEVQKGIRNLKKLDSSKNASYQFFFSMMEYSLFENYYKDEKRTVYMLPYDYVSLLSLRAQAYFFIGDTEKWKENIRLALKYNPTSVDLLFLSADMNCQCFNYFSFMMDLDKMYPFLYKEEDIKKYYRYLSKYYSDFELNNRLSRILLKIGDPDKSVSIKKTFSLLTKKQKDFLDKYQIPHEVSPLVIDTALKEAKQAVESNDIQSYKYFYSILTPYLNDKEINEGIQK